nr:DUF4214 domain-containing protein [uncultured Undibacterium sp.]
MYDVDQNSVDATLSQGTGTVFSDATIANILALATKTNDQVVKFEVVRPNASGVVGPIAGTEVAIVNFASDAPIAVSGNVPVVVFQGRGGVNVTLNDAASSVPSSSDHNVLQPKVDRVVVGSAGNDKIVVTDARNTQIVLGSGDSTVQTGRGIDTVEAGLGNSTIVGGIGDYAVVKLAGNASNYTVTAQNGHAIVTDMTTNKTTDISKIQYVQLGDGSALVFAKNSVEGQVANLYHTAFGRDADAGGLNYWFDAVKGGATLKQVANAFVSSAEFAPFNSLSNFLFIDGLYMNTFGRHGEESGMTYWMDQMAKGATKADMVANFATIAIQNVLGGATFPEVQVVGSVHVIQNII